MSLLEVTALIVAVFFTVRWSLTSRTQVIRYVVSVVLAIIVADHVLAWLDVSLQLDSPVELIFAVLLVFAYMGLIFVFLVLLSLVTEWPAYVTGSGSSASRRIPVILLLVIFTLLVFYVWLSKSQNAAQRAEMEQYLHSTIDYYRQLPLAESKTGPYVRRGVLVIDVGNKTIDNLSLQLPRSLRVSRQEDILSVVLVRWTKEQLGTYTDGDARDRYVCRMAIIDITIPATINTKEFQQDDPFQKTIWRSEGGGYYDETWDTEDNLRKEVLEYLTHLPVR